MSVYKLPPTGQACRRWWERRKFGCDSAGAAAHTKRGVEIFGVSLVPFFLIQYGKFANNLFPILKLLFTGSLWKIHISVRSTTVLASATIITEWPFLRQRNGG